MWYFWIWYCIIGYNKKLFNTIWYIIWCDILFNLYYLYYDKILYDIIMYFIIFLLWYNILLYDIIFYIIYIELILIKINMVIKGYRF